jgi:hypothetical protein
LPSHRLRDPNLAAADLRNEPVRDVVLTGQRKIGICARANVVDVVPRQPAVFPFQQFASGEARDDLKLMRFVEAVA